jgi:hypothetical protein
LEAQAVPEASTAPDVPEAIEDAPAIIAEATEVVNSEDSINVAEEAPTAVDAQALPADEAPGEQRDVPVDDEPNVETISHEPSRLETSPDEEPLTAESSAVAQQMKSN